MDKFKLFEAIEGVIDIENYVRPPYRRNGTTIENDWFEKHEQINKNIREKNIITEFQNIYFEFGFDNKIKNICLQLETRNIQPENQETITSSDGNEVTIVRRNYEELGSNKQDIFQFDRNEFINYKRLKNINDILNENI